ncbi:MAG: hypothetical protein OZ935_05110, partial [Pseudomonadota bacterium]|nr:hypothetical protein [Pseudomonadota bacterium]
SSPARAPSSPSCTAALPSSFPPLGFRILANPDRTSILTEGGEGSVQTMNRILGVLGLKLGVVRASAPDSDEP